MKTTDFKLTKYEADENKVFDWKEPRFTTVKDEEGNKVEVQEHLYVHTIFIGPNDSIENYIEIEKPTEKTEE